MRIVNRWRTREGAEWAIKCAISVAMVAILGCTLTHRIPATWFALAWFAAIMFGAVWFIAALALNSRQLSKAFERQRKLS